MAKPMDPHYWELAPKGREICLNCPRGENSICFYDEKDRGGEDCPEWRDLPRSVQGVRHIALKAIEEIIEKYGALPAKQLNKYLKEDYAIDRQILYGIIKANQVLVERIPRTTGRYKYTIKVLGVAAPNGN